MLMSTIKAVIFDLDGTLIDSEPNYLEADKRIFADYGFLDYNMEIHSQYIGFGSKEMMEDMKKKYHINESIEKLIDAFKKTIFHVVIEHKVQNSLLFIIKYK